MHFIRCCWTDMFPLFLLIAAQQEAERSKFIVMKAEQEKRAAVIRAEGESEAARLVSRHSSFQKIRRSLNNATFQRTRLYAR